MISSRFAFHAPRIALLLAMLLQMAAASPVQSAAFDEGYSLTYGYAYLRTGDARLSRGQNPPLTNLLITLPLFMRNDIALPLDHPTWAEGDVYGFSDEFLWKANPDPHRLVMLARLPAMALALLLACVVHAFTRSLFGEHAALAALFLCAFDPNVLAHGHIAGTDLGMAFFLFAAVWRCAAAMRQMSLRRAIVAGLLGGAALASKYSAAWLMPMVLAIAALYPAKSGLASGRLARLRLLIGFGLAGFLVIWGTFGFSLGPLSPGGLPVPAPDYWASLTGVRNRVESGTPAFMLGNISPTGFVPYYPFVLLVKTPLPTLLLMLAGIVAVVARRDRTWVAVVFPPALFLLAAVLNNLSLGYRLILPVLPFGLLLAGRGMDTLLSTAERLTTKTPRPARRLRAVGAVAATTVWLALDSLAVAPNHIAYFNLLVNRDRDYEALVDSNLDWGQDLIALREWMGERRIDTINLSYFGTAHPEAYGIRAHRLPGFALDDFGPEVDGFNASALEPGWYAVSATSLQLGLVYTHWHMYAPFRARRPEARVGRSILVYRIDYAVDEIDRAVVLGPVASDLDAATLGGHPDRRLIVKWAGRDAAIIDMQGRARYVARGGEPLFGFAPGAREALLAVADRLGNDESGDLRLFEIDARRALDAKLESLARATLAAADAVPLAPPIEFEGGLTLLGYDRSAAPSIDWVTYWRVRERPMAGLAVFAHALDAGGALLAQGDGLNVRLSALETGDIILQHFVIDRPAEAVWLDVGLYDPATSRRMTAQLPDGRLIDRVRIALP
jgi:hypothetical protein